MTPGALILAATGDAAATAEALAEWRKLVGYAGSPPVAARPAVGTTVAGDTSAGAIVIMLAASVDLRVGDQVTVGSTEYSVYAVRGGTSLTITPPLSADVADGAAVSRAAVEGAAAVDGVDGLLRADQAIHAEAALEVVARFLGEDVDVPARVLSTAIFRLSGYLATSSRGIAELEPAGLKLDMVAAQAPLRRSGAMSVLRPWKSAGAGVI